MSAALVEALPAKPAAKTAEAVVRRTMIDTQLRTNMVIEPRLVAAIESVDRSAFVPDGDLALVYSDRCVPLRGGRALNPVLTTTRLIMDADVRPGQSVLLIGAATGYAAAVIAALGARVIAVESDPALLALAKQALAGVELVTLVDADLNEGAPLYAPYDRIIIDGAIAAVPAALVAQLADGGRLATGLDERGVTRLARAVRVAGQDKVHLVAFVDLESVRLPGFSPPPRFHF